jgi:hypothetical protein
MSRIGVGRHGRIQVREPAVPLRAVRRDHLALADDAVDDQGNAA